jgi:hypothetical protein
MCYDVRRTERELIVYEDVYDGKWQGAFLTVYNDGFWSVSERRLVDLTGEETHLQYLELV